MPESDIQVNLLSIAWLVNPRSLVVYYYRNIAAVGQVRTRSFKSPTLLVRSFAVRVYMRTL
jgi:hypothetical protein